MKVDCTDGCVVDADFDGCEQADEEEYIRGWFIKRPYQEYHQHIGQTEQQANRPQHLNDHNLRPIQSKHFPK